MRYAIRHSTLAFIYTLQLVLIDIVLVHFVAVYLVLAYLALALVTEVSFEVSHL